MKGSPARQMNSFPAHPVVRAVPCRAAPCERGRGPGQPSRTREWIPYLAIFAAGLSYTRSALNGGTLSLGPLAQLAAITPPLIMVMAGRARWWRCRQPAWASLGQPPPVIVSDRITTPIIVLSPLIVRGLHSK